ncbi:MAG TPA: AI-2E family transporter [Vicinamibacterales bacterium]|nr:AI-2E family transporter [Vicinamibacterales bacterium]
MISDREFTRRLLQTVATIAAAVVLIAAVWEARAALMLVYVSALIAMGLSPIVQFVERTRPGKDDGVVPRWLAILSVYLVIVGVIVLLGLLVLPPLVAQAASLWARAPAEFDKAQRWLLQHRLMTRRITFEQAVENAPSGASANAVGTVLVAISSLVGGVFAVITILILSFYFLIEAQPMFDYLIRFVPAERRGAVSVAARQAVVKVSAWLQAQFVLAGTMGMFVTVGLWWMGVPYFYVLALVAAIGETIPVVGPIIGGIAATAVALSVSPKLALMCGVYFLILHQLEANVLVPKIMERRVGVSPVAVLVALLVGAELYGLVGAILAIPTAAILSVIVEEIAAGQDAVRMQRVR